MNRPIISPPRRTGAPLVRAAAIALTAFANKTHIASELRNWRDSKDAELVLKAATVPGSMTGSGWADSFAQTSVMDFVSTLGPASAGSALLTHGLQLDFGRSAQIVVPTIFASSAGTSFIGEGSPLPVRQFAFTGPTLSPKKVGTISDFTRESFEHSTPSVEAIVRDVLTRDVGQKLDQAMLSTSAGDSVTPPGLLNGVSALTPSANTDHDAAMTEDVIKLAASVRSVAGNGEVVFIASANQFERLHNRFGFPYLHLASSALAAGTVVCIAPVALASAVDPLPRFDISITATVVERDDPTAISIVGTPPTIAVPTRSYFQTDVIGLKMVFQMDWILRSTSGLSWMSAVIW